MPETEDYVHETVVEFRPGWPAILPHGLVVARSSVTQLDADDDVDIPDEDDVSWIIHIGARVEPPRLAMMGELVVKNPLAFGGSTVILPFELRDEPEVITSEYLQDTLDVYGPWASSFMYDHAATVLRSALGGYGLQLIVPFGTPPVQLHGPNHDAETSAPE